VKRPVGQCSTHSPANPLLTITAPASIAKDCATGGAAFGPQLSGTGVTGNVVMALDADENAGTPSDQPANPFDLGGSAYDGCSPFTNGPDLAGKIVMVNRGLCGFEVKARNVDAAGATGVIIANRNDGEVFTMSGDADPDPAIPSVMIDKVDRTSIATELDAAHTVTVTMKDASGDRTDSFRWLMGEDSWVFGGAIRDMWSPTCYGDPGKVSDAQYVCSSDDSGGVHSNSGVPNHGYALLVDGGTYNDIPVTGIGLTKAAAIYYKAMTDYQTPVSGFADHGDSLEAACADLTGKAIHKLSTDPNDSQIATVKISSADCTQVHAMTQAIELRLDPTSECDWHPILDPNAPEPCGADFIENEVYSEDFEDGLDGWTRSGENPFGGPTFDWEAKASTPGEELPEGHTGHVAFGPAPDAGACDGSNVRMSVNGGAFEVIPASAFTFNGYNADMRPAPGNTSPLAGQPGFTGTNPGSPFGSWGESQIDLVAAGAAVGDTIQLQFAIGRDGCGGVEGWYVGNVNNVDCVEKAMAVVTPVHAPEPAAYGASHDLTAPVASPGDPAATPVPTGSVTVKEGTTTLGTGDLENGVLTVALATTMPVGAHDLTIEYSGDEAYKASSAPTSINVAKAAAAISAVHAPEPAAYSSHKLTVTVDADDAISTPSGAVTVKEGTTTLGSGELVNGVVDVTLPSTMSVGAHALTVEYAGDGSYQAGTQAASINVKKATSTTTAKPTVLKVTKAKVFYVNVKVTAPGVTPTGVMKIYKGTTLLAKGTLSGGAVKVKVPTTDLAVAKHTLVAKYGGSTTVSPSQKSFTITVVR